MEGEQAVRGVSEATLVSVAPRLDCVVSLVAAVCRARRAALAGLLAGPDDAVRPLDGNVLVDHLLVVHLHKRTKSTHVYTIYAYG